MPLVLGGFTFSDMELPEKITGLGGKQALAKHKMVGGARIADAMGPDDGDIEWSGRFRGLLATSRAQQLDAMRRAGQKLPLSFGTFFYLAVIEEFNFQFERAYQLIYQIKLFVVSAPPPNPGLSLDAIIISDLDFFTGMIGQYTAQVGQFVPGIP
jgi:hypothetical protein